MNFNILIICLFFLFLNSFCNLIAQSTPNLLSGQVSEQELQKILLSQADWKPFPLISERQKWNQIPEKVRNLYIKNGEQFLNKSWDQLSATLFLEFVRSGNRSNYQTVFKNKRLQLEALILAEIFENKKRFIDDIVNGIWSICEESFWGAPAHLNHQKKGFGLPDISDPAIDFYVAETGTLLACAYYFLGERLNEVSPRITERINEEERRRIIIPYLSRDFSWEGRGENAKVNNWNPWINSNLLPIVFFLESDIGKRSNLVYQIMQSLDVFINGYTEDGACDEGPSIWVHAAGSMFSALEILNSASNGKINIYDVPLIKRMGQYIYKAWIADEYYINFADASAIVKPDAGLVYRYGKRIDDPLLVGFGAMLGKQQKFDESLNLSPHGSLINTLLNLFIIDDMSNAEIIKPFLKEVWMPGREIFAARSFPNSSEGLYIAAKGGNNAENHNHNDVGNFIIYCDGKPVIIYIGIELSRTELKQKYTLIESKEPYFVTDRIIFLGEIPRKNSFEAQSTPFVTNNNLDDYVIDDSALALKSEKGLIIITGCSHSGICNIIDYAKHITGFDLVYGVIGGFHLKSDDEQTRETIHYFRKENIQKIYPTHCTAEPALGLFYQELNALKAVAGDGILI